MKKERSDRRNHFVDCFRTVDYGFIENFIVAVNQWGAVKADGSGARKEHCSRLVFCSAVDDMDNISIWTDSAEKIESTVAIIVPDRVVRNGGYMESVYDERPKQ